MPFLLPHWILFCIFPSFLGSLHLFFGTFPSLFVQNEAPTPCLALNLVQKEPTILILCYILFVYSSLEEVSPLFFTKNETCSRTQLTRSRKRCKTCLKRLKVALWITSWTWSGVKCSKISLLCHIFVYLLLCEEFLPPFFYKKCHSTRHPIN